MITVYDYTIIGFYLVFMLAIGVVFRRMSKNTSDYFRAGGAMPVAHGSVGVDFQLQRLDVHRCGGKSV